MKFFTPDLYESFALGEPQNADRMASKWEAAEKGYEQELASIRQRLPATVRTLADTFCLKEAMLVNFQASESDAVLWLRQGNVLYSLHYHLAGEVKVERVRNSESLVWREKQPRWLYDEIGLMNGLIFSHEILLSSGYMVLILFDDFQYSVQEVHPVGTSQSLNAFSQFLPIIEQIQPKRTENRKSNKLSIPMADVRAMARLARHARRNLQEADVFGNAEPAGLLIWPPTFQQAPNEAKQSPSSSRKSNGRKKSR